MRSRRLAIWSVTLEKQADRYSQVILHSSSAQLEVLADSFWTPLFADDSKKTSKTKTVAGGEDIGDDGIRNVKAACIGKLTTTAPAKFLPQLQVRPGS